MITKPVHNAKLTLGDDALGRAQGGRAGVLSRENWISEAGRTATPSYWSDQLWTQQQRSFQQSM